ncbi:hypothetical protein HMPREF0083_05568 [Aneurinibacillus aneurinilyticus ATCC 12856]|uniref:Uncharacterized protein n=1 Tax=Aneurinibacillus aneurinilyticus ATCC 12856 TaxID=649747 RepID=U1Y482_ANEAE|nr:hypothetical protein HMPREF0083_05568 [Aneurinibacillus aneurinilyticus ATCC 12856]
MLFSTGAIFAEEILQKIDVTLPSLKFIVDGADKTPMNNLYEVDGKKVPSTFVYEGFRTYLCILLLLFQADP